VAVCVGQGGVQAGWAWWASLSDAATKAAAASTASAREASALAAALSVWTEPEPGEPPPSSSSRGSPGETSSSAAVSRARCVCVDTESKVVRVAARGWAAGWRPAAVVCGRNGRGNNWARGYAADELLQEALDAIAYEVERCHRMPDIVLVHSLAGGSGSGLGSRLLEGLRDRYGPEPFVVSVALAPRLEGDVAVQAFNTLLALQWLQAYADAVLLFQNSELLRVPKSVGGSGGGGGGGSGSLKAANEYVGRGLAAALCVAGARDVVQTVAPMPALKLCELRVSTSAPAQSKGVTDWVAAVRALGASTPKFDALDGSSGGRRATTLAALLVAPPPPASDEARARSALQTEARKQELVRFAPWQARAQETAHVRFAGDPLACAAASRAGVCSVANRSSCVGFVEATVERAEALLAAGAYVWQYERHGVPAAALAEAAEAARSVADDYRLFHAIPSI